MAKPPDVTVTRIGDRVIEQPDEQDELAELNALSRPADDTQAPSVTELTPEEELELGEVSTVAPAEAMVSPADASQQYARGSAAGVLETAPAVAGAIYGSRFAPFVAPFMGPAAPFAPVVTGGVGFMAGLLAGKPLSEILVEAPESKDLVPYFEGGKTFGSTIAFAPAAFYLPSQIGTRIGPYISKIGEFARKYRKSFLLGEASAGVSSSGGTILAEEYAPGQAGVRFGAELTFGIANPVRFVPTLTAAGGKNSSSYGKRELGSQKPVANSLWRRGRFRHRMKLLVASSRFWNNKARIFLP